MVEENKIKKTVMNVKEIWASLMRLGGLTTVYDKEGKEINKVTLKFSYAISKNITILKSEIDLISAAESFIKDFGNENAIIDPKDYTKKAALLAKYTPKMEELDILHKEEREIYFYKIKADMLPVNGVAGIDLANLEYLIEGEIA